MVSARHQLRLIASNDRVFMGDSIQPSLIQGWLIE
jgi:hypothetical protein